MKHILILACLLIACGTIPEEEILIQEIGTSYYKLEDQNRPDNFYGGNRILNLQIWYPADHNQDLTSLQKAPYYYGIEEAFPNLENWSRADYEFVRQIKTNAYLDAAIQSGVEKFPLIIFSPSLGGNISMYTYYAEQLAFSGYIIVGVNHLYESEYIIDKNDSLINANLFFHDSLKTLEIPRQISAEGYRAAKGPRQEILGDDLIFCLNQITALNEPLFKDKIDLEKVGVWGHSIGGAASVFAALKDSRFDAVLDLDGTPPSIALESGINQPFMFIEDRTDYENHVGYQKLHARRNNFCTKINAPAYRVLIPETNHNSFLDIHYHSIEDPTEKAEALSVLETTFTYMNTFFNIHLKGTEEIVAPIQCDSLEIFVFNPK